MKDGVHPQTPQPQKTAQLFYDNKLQREIHVDELRFEYDLNRKYAAMPTFEDWIMQLVDIMAITPIR